MKALINPIELVTNPDGTSGYRIVQVEVNPFEVAEPLYWLICNADVVADQYYLNTTTNSIQIKPIITPEEEIPEAPTTATELMAQLLVIQKKLKALTANVSNI